MERETLPSIPSIPPATCTVCGGTEIIFAESELNIVKPYLVAKHPIGQDGNRTFDYIKMEMNVLICTDCGHSVFYAKEPQKLKNKREGMDS